MKKTWLLLPLAASMLLTSCGGEPGASESSSESSIDTSEATSDSPASSEKTSESTSVDEPLEDLSDVTFDIAVGSSGELSDFRLGFAAIVDYDHLLAFSFNKADTSKAVVYTDRPSVATIVKKGDAWYLHTLKAGKTHLIIEDDEGIIHLRMVVNVENRVAKEDALHYLISVDHWEVKREFVSFCGDFDVTFFDGGSAVMSGYDSEGVNLNGATFNIALDETLTGGNYLADLWYSFSVTNWTIPDFNLASIYMHASGTYMHMHTNNALLGIMVPGEAA